MNTLQAPPTATDRLRNLLDLIDEHGYEDLPGVVVELGHDMGPFAGAESTYLLAVLRHRAEDALREMEGRA